MGSPTGAVYMAAARLGCKRALVPTWWANFSPTWINKLRQHYCRLVEGSFLAGNAGYSMLVHEWE